MDGNQISYSIRSDGRRYFTNADMAEMVDRGLIDPEDRWELIRGEWFDMPSEGYQHMSARTLLCTEFILQLGRRPDIRVNSEGSYFFSGDTELRPDMAIYRADVGTNAMTGSDLFLVAEIMASSHHRDTELKRPIYAEIGVPELWLIDLEAATITVHRRPENGVYQDIRTVDETTKISAAAFPDVSISLADLKEAPGT